LKLNFPKVATFGKFFAKAKIAGLKQLGASFIYNHSRREFMFIAQQRKTISKIPKGLHVKINRKYIQSLRDFGHFSTYSFYKHKFTSGIVVNEKCG
jgi:hypothetical protein